ncbi:hypothetical protein [Nonlabens marinus]|uniref:Uncharacterized protein n=1 Tax=Nonlabens marinus S1-08 TaxID=1454201 RepID=W8VQY0_9FLAO|nr:hypothetical protein [Nonlabens marinus]BAO55964.1 hypothetical protein NMS_1955 [Nonlabens marinus S1-08]
MKTLETNLNIQKIRQIDCADLFFIDDLVIVEVKMHTLVGKKQLEHIIEAIENEILDISKVHFISNRVDPYSLKPTEFPCLKKKIDSFKSYSVVTYGSVGVTNLIFERMFLKSKIVRFDSLLEAIASKRGKSGYGGRAFFVA